VGGRQQYELWAEVLRDMGILFFVFAPLDTLLKTGRGNETDWLIAIAIAIIGLLFILVGIKIGTEQ
jgi:LPXTG-motif cell wall-anchored protein